MNELWYLIVNEELVEKVYNEIMLLTEIRTRSLVPSNDLWGRPKLHVNKQKRKSELKATEKTKNKKLLQKNKKKHPNTGRYGIKTEVMREWFRAKIIFPKERDNHQTVNQMEVKQSLIDPESYPARNEQGC